VPTAARIPRLSPWGRLVAVSAILVVGFVALLASWDLASRHERVVTTSVAGNVDGLDLDVGDADVVIAGGGKRPAIGIERTDRFAFGHDARVAPVLDGSVFRLRSRCPRSVPSTCAVGYRITVPDNVPVDVRTAGGSVRFADYTGSARVATGSGDVDVSGFCGFSLQARAESGDIAASTACPLQRLTLRSTSGAVRATVPPARYSIEAESASGDEEVVGLQPATDAIYAIQALSSSGDVRVERRGP
jgi:putative adhesin